MEGGGGEGAGFQVSHLRHSVAGCSETPLKGIAATQPGHRGEEVRQSPDQSSGSRERRG